jgi:hypothetical protein
MATAAQKANIARFKAVQAEAKKLKSKNKNLTHIQAVKQAWTILYNKNTKLASKTAKKRKIGALPIGFTGKILGVPFKVVNQFDIYGEVNAIVENTETGKKIIVIDGKTSTKDLADKFFAHIKMNVDYQNINDIPKDTLQRISKFVINLSKEVKDYNAGKKQTIKKQPLVIVAEKKPVAKMKVFNPYMPDVDYSERIKKAAKKKAAPKRKTATKKSSSGTKKLTYVGVRKLESGASRYEYKLAGIGSFGLKAIEESIKRLNEYQVNLDRVNNSLLNSKKLGFHKNYIAQLKQSKKRYIDLIKETKIHITQLKKNI